MNTAASLPLLGPAPLDSSLAWQNGREVSRARFLAHAASLAERLRGESGAALLLCGNRYNFMVAFAATLVRGHTALLPPGRAPGLVAALETEWSAYRLDDHDVESAADGAAADETDVPRIAADQVAAVLFTSGSTGRPRAQAKTWGELHGVTRCALERFGLDTGTHHIVATVPAQHSYGFESSALYALLGPCAAHGGHPLYPADVRAALETVAAPRVLVTTPLHLDVCLRAGLEWPELACVLSATAPLAPELAGRAEAVFRAPLFEIYGCSEAGALASRRTCRDTTWSPYAGVELMAATQGCQVLAPYLDGPRPLADCLRFEPDGRFTLLGRAGDQIKLAGKRSSLAELNHHLLAIDGVEDGSFVVPDATDARLAAVVVAPRLSVAEIRGRLAEVIDPVFMPRPLVRVARLQRTDTGKLQRPYLLGIIARQSAPPSRERA